jgi:hypothetical protein
MARQRQKRKTNCPDVSGNKDRSSKLWFFAVGYCQQISFSEAIFKNEFKTIMNSKVAQDQPQLRTVPEKINRAIYFCPFRSYSAVSLSKSSNM